MKIISQRPSESDAPYSVDTTPIKHADDACVIAFDFPVAGERSGMISSFRELSSFLWSNLEPTIDVRLGIRTASDFTTNDELKLAIVTKLETPPTT